MTQSSSTRGLWLGTKDVFKPLRQLSPVELRALAYGITPFYKLNDNILYGFDEKGQTKAVYVVPERKAVKRTFLMRLLRVPDCVDVCGHNLKRRHTICGVCRWPKIIKGELPPVLPVTVYVLSMGMNRKFERAQGWLVKKITSLQEYVALWGENSKS
jgi:hypothetical protein